MKACGEARRQLENQGRRSVDASVAISGGFWLSVIRG